MNLKNKKAILWDNDGVLVDTEKYFFKATQEVLQKFSIEFTKEMFIDLMLIQAVGPWHLLEKKGYDKQIIQEQRAERDRLYTYYLETNELLIDGIANVLNELHGKFLMGIVTSSKPHHFNSIHSHSGILHNFDFVITPDFYQKYKPDPEPYLVGWKKTNFTKEECLVVEDSRRGLIAAKAAGLECIIIPNELTKSSDFSEADLVIENVEELRECILTSKV